MWLASVAVAWAELPSGDGAAPAAGAGQMSSPQSETRPDAARAAASAGQPKDALFGIGDERPGIRIGWYFDAAVDGFRSAIDRNVPFVLVISEDWCNYCAWLVDALTCPSVNLFAGGAVFAISAPSRDTGAQAIAGSLNIDTYPTITVLMPEARILLEVARINGYFSGDALAGLFEMIQRDYDLGVSQRVFEGRENPRRSRWEFVVASKAAAVLTPLSKIATRPSRCPTPWLGIRAEDMDDATAQALGWSTPRGVVIKQLIDGSPAARSTLIAGDVITAIDDRPIAVRTDLIVAVAAYRPKDHVTIQVFRHGAWIKVPLTLEAGTDPFAN
jgi:hypothetical protein